MIPTSRAEESRGLGRGRIEIHGACLDVTLRWRERRRKQRRHTYVELYSIIRVKKKNSISPWMDSLSHYWREATNCFLQRLFASTRNDDFAPALSMFFPSSFKFLYEICKIAIIVRLFRCRL